MFPATQNDYAKNVRKKAENKTNLLQYISLQFTFPQIIPLQNDTQALNIMFPAAQNDEAKNAKKPKQNKLATVKIV